VQWGTVLRATLVPSFSKDSLYMLVAILGTTISPYLFFWQATLEAEDVSHHPGGDATVDKRGDATAGNPGRVMVDKRALGDMRRDVNFGMLFSNLVMFFIILTAGSVLYPHGIRQIDTIEQAAGALKPLTGKLTYLLFSVGVIGTGLLAIPVLAGSVSYIVSETFALPQGLDKKFREARVFYTTLIASVLLGLVVSASGLSAVQALIYTAILYGLTAPVMIGVILHIANNKAIMGQYTNSRFSNILGWVTLLFMTAAAVGVCVFF
jgi:Mn2+/Fe2+ NRAMP family transporter